MPRKPRLCRVVRVCVVAALLPPVGCSPTDLPAGQDATIEQVDNVRNSAGLTPQEKREELRRFGFDEVTINGLLASERLGNQFGGDLESALVKIDEARMLELTPDEVQFYGDATAVTQYSDTEALAISRLFAEAGVTDVESLTEFLDDPASDVGAAINDDNLRAIFIDFDIDTVRDDLP